MHLAYLAFVSLCKLIFVLKNKGNVLTRQKKKTEQGYKTHRHFDTADVFILKIK